MVELRTKQYEKYLLGCRFCPMCKPASDTSNATYLECHSTRAHAMIIWRVSNGIKEYTNTEIELLYKTNLDGVSEAFCVDHYPVSAYLLAARQDIVQMGKAPEHITKVFDRTQNIRVKNVKEGGVAILSTEAAGFAYEESYARICDLAKKLDVGVIQGYSGVEPYSLGNTQKAKDEATALVKAITDSKVKKIIADGSETWYALMKLYPEIGIELSSDIEFENMNNFAFDGKDISQTEISNQEIFFHDARASYHMCNAKPDELVIMPDFFGPEALLGTGDVYELPRSIVERMNARRKFSVWSRAMARGIGMDDALFLTYPKLALKLAERRITEIINTGAAYLVTDSFATVMFLGSINLACLKNIKIIWLPELA